MTIASGLRPRRQRVPTALADGGTGARTREEAVVALEVPALDADNVFTGTNSFTGTSGVFTSRVWTDVDLTFLTTDVFNFQDGGGTNYVEFLGAANSIAFPNASGTLALLSDITAGGGNGVVATVDFGSAFTPFASVVVTGETWVAAGSKIAVTPKAGTGTEVEVALMAFSCVVSDLVAGVGFTLNVFTPIEAKGTYNFSCVGV